MTKFTLAMMYLKRFDTYVPRDPFEPCPLAWELEDHSRSFKDIPSILQ